MDSSSMTKRKPIERLNMSVVPGTTKKVEELREFYCSIGGFNLSAFLNNKIDELYDYTMKNKDIIIKESEGKTA